MKKIFLLSPIIFFAIQLSAQNTFRKTLFGIEAGANYSNMNFKKGVPPTDIPQTYQAGVRLGALLHISLLNNVALQPEYFLSTFNGYNKVADVHYKLFYTSSTVLVNYAIIPNLSIVAGPELGLLIKGRAIEKEKTINITNTTEQRSIGITGGIQNKITQNIFTSLRYMQGLNHIKIMQGSNSMEYKSQQVQLVAGITF